MATNKSWKTIVDRIDPDRKKEPIVYEFGGGKKKIKDKRDPYESAKN